MDRRQQKGQLKKTPQPIYLKTSNANQRQSI